MKQYTFKLNQATLDKFFIVIRSKVSTIEVLMEALKYMIINPVVNEDNIKGTLVLKIDKMSRLFFFTEEKYFSLVFPFFINYDEDENEYSFSSSLVNTIDNRLISQVIEIINCDEFKTNCSLEFATPICDVDEHCSEYFWSFLRELLLMEDGYLRYDYDPINHAKYQEKGEEHRHPLNHYDVFYSSNATFKVGLTDKIDEDELINFLDSATNCKYLTSPTT